jgi:hypothetical protein
MFIRVSSLPLALAFLAAGCQPDASEDGCQPGTEACVCIEGGLCVPGLVCASNVCVDLDETTGMAPDSGGSGKPGTASDGATTSTSGDTSGGTSGGTSTTTTSTGGPSGSCVGQCGGLGSDGSCWCDAACDALANCCDDFLDACPGLCASKFDCADDEVCSTSTGECVPALPHTYSIYVDLWRDYGPVCWDVDECLADVYFNMYVGGTFVTSSVVWDDVIDASWATPGVANLTADRTFVVEFYDYDALDENDLVTWYCPTNIDGQCWSPPISVLRDGYLGTYTSASQYYWIELRFVPE